MATKQEIQAEQLKFPGLTEAAAIGNIASARRRATTQPPLTGPGTPGAPSARTLGPPTSPSPTVPGPNPSQLRPEDRGADRPGGTPLPGFDTEGNKLPGASFDTFGNFVGNAPLAGVVGSSDVVVNQERDLTTQIGGFFNISESEERATQASSDFISLLRQQQSDLQKRREEEVAGLETEFAEKEKGTRAAQAREAGTFGVGLQRIGGFLGGSASAEGALINLADTQESELVALEGRKQAAITKAKNAIDEKDFQLARDIAAEVKDLSKTIDDRRQQFFTNALALTREARAGRTEAREETRLEFDIEKSLADLTGTFRGAPTFDAEQKGLQNLLDIAGLTGEFLGESTIQGKRLILDEAFKRASATGVFEGQPTLQALSLQETIRSNRAQESLRAQSNAISAAKATQAAKPLTQGTMNELAAKGIDNETALAINKFFATNETRQIGQEASGAGIFIDPIEDAKAAISALGFNEDIIDTYINTITQPSLLEQFTSFTTGGGDGITNPNE